MARLQKIQSNHAFKMLKELGYRDINIQAPETAKILRGMGFKIAAVRHNARAISSYIHNDVDAELSRKAAALGISKAALIRDVLHQFCNRKIKVV